MSLKGAETPHGAPGSAKSNKKNPIALENAANENRNCSSKQFFSSLLGSCLAQARKLSKNGAASRISHQNPLTGVQLMCTFETKAVLILAYSETSRGEQMHTNFRSMR